MLALTVGRFLIDKSNNTVYSDKLGVFVPAPKGSFLEIGAQPVSGAEANSLIATGYLADVLNYLSKEEKSRLLGEDTTDTTSTIETDEAHNKKPAASCNSISSIKVNGKPLILDIGD